MAKINEEKRKGWRPGRNLLTLILLIIILFVIFLAIYIPTTISKSYNEGKVEYFQDYDSITYVKDYYNKDKVEYIENSSDFNVFNVTLKATSYTDNKDDVYVIGKDSGNGDKIKFSLAIEQKDTDNPVSFSTVPSTTYVIYAALCTATNWVGDHGYTTALRYTADNIKNNYSRTTTLECNVSYPVKKTICWPFSKTIDTPDVYLYIFYFDDYQKEHHYVVRYTYDEYITSDTEGRIIKA